MSDFAGDRGKDRLGGTNVRELVPFFIEQDGVQVVNEELKVSGGGKGSGGKGKKKEKDINQVAAAANRATGVRPFAIGHKTHGPATAQPQAQPQQITNKNNKWAGGAFLNAPAPNSLPMPKIPLPHGQAPLHPGHAGGQPQGVLNDPAILSSSHGPGAHVNSAQGIGNGAQVTAMFVDGEWYDGTVVGVNLATCMVLFFGYENEGPYEVPREYVRPKHPPPPQHPAPPPPSHPAPPPPGHPGLQGAPFHHGGGNANFLIPRAPQAAPQNSHHQPAAAPPPFQHPAGIPQSPPQPTNPGPGLLPPPGQESALSVEEIERRMFSSSIQEPAPATEALPQPNIPLPQPKIPLPQPPSQTVSFHTAPTEHRSQPAPSQDKPSTAGSQPHLKYVPFPGAESQAPSMLTPAALATQAAAAQQPLPQQPAAQPHSASQPHNLIAAPPAPVQIPPALPLQQVKALPARKPASSLLASAMQ